MHARRVSNPRISRPPSPEYHHERTPSAPLLRRAPSPGPHKLHSPFASFAAGRPRSQQRRIIALLVGALTVVVMCVVVFSQLSNIDTRLLDAYHAATRGTRVGAEQEGGVLAVAGTLQEAETSSKPQGLEIEPEELDSDPVEEAEEGSERVLEAGWSEAQQQEEEQQQMDLTNLPPCKRTMVFKMAGTSRDRDLGAETAIADSPIQQACTGSALSSTFSFGRRPLPASTTTPSCRSTRPSGTTGRSRPSSILPSSTVDHRKRRNAAQS